MPKFRNAACLLGALSLLPVAVALAQSATPAVSTIVAFNASNPIGNIVRGADGALYGVAVPGTTITGGLVYRVAVDGTSTTTLYQMQPADGLSPGAGLLLGKDGNLYGTTKFGRSGESNSTGIVFRVSQSGAGFTVIYRFAPLTAVNPDLSVVNTTGAYPEAELAEGSDGYLYGTTRSGGPNGTGTIFRLSRDGTDFKLLHSFTRNTAVSETKNADGAAPVGQLLQAANGYFYGTTSTGGTNGQGTIFRIAFDGTGFQVLKHFDATPNKDPSTGLPENDSGSGPLAGLTDGNDGFLYGVAAFGGASGLGAVFAMTPDGGTFSVLHNFAGPNGAQPVGELLLGSDGKLYGTTSAGGQNAAGETTSFGTVFSIDRAGTGFARLYSFDSTAGTAPNSRLVELSSGLFAGGTAAGGACSFGTIYRWSRAGETIEGNKTCGRKKNNSGGGAAGPALLLLFGGLALWRRRPRADRAR
jgi:uncharacterized repeat protein (TIGR03803 family)